MTTASFEQLPLLALENDWYTTYKDLPVEEQLTFLKRPCTYRECVCKGKGSLRFGTPNGSSSFPYRWLHTMENPQNKHLEIVNALCAHSSSPLYNTDGVAVTVSKDANYRTATENYRNRIQELLDDPDKPGYLIRYRGYATSFTPVRLAYERAMGSPQKKQPPSAKHDRKRKRELKKMINEVMAKKEKKAKKAKSPGWDIANVPKDDTARWPVTLHYGRHAYRRSYFMASKNGHARGSVDRVFVELEISEVSSAQTRSVTRVFKVVESDGGTDFYLGIELFKHRTEVPSQEAQTAIVRAGITHLMATV